MGVVVRPIHVAGVRGPSAEKNTRKGRDVLIRSLARAEGLKGVSVVGLK